MVENIVFTVCFLAVVCLVSICCAVHSKTEKRNERKEKTFIDLYWQSWVTLAQIYSYCQEHDFPFKYFLEKLKQSKYYFFSTVVETGCLWIGTKEEMEKAEEEIKRAKAEEEKRLQQSLQKSVSKSLDKNEKV